ncbi:cupin domain-containing protein [Inquilinus limosus]|uniref:cupin domain-containing protein n=1 Tax=Inquilinus limosus TaxID=171674 RepID=UPI00068FBCB0|nr:cupin domain-containing protein [Inquilinus limosus]
MALPRGYIFHGDLPNLDSKLEPLFCTVQPGAGSPDSYTHEGEEAAIALSGALELWVDKKLYVLGAGDSLALAGTWPHRCRNPGPALPS